MIHAGYMLDINIGYYIIKKYRIDIMSKQKIGLAKFSALIMMRNIMAVTGINTHRSAGGRTHICCRFCQAASILMTKILT